jgi:GT2 family glycosyltransferase
VNERSDLTTASIVVINWNLAELTTRCVREIVADGFPEERIVVVDNGSSDDSVDQLRAELPACVHVALPDNIGYARAANAGARGLPGDVYLFVNNDAFVHRPGSIGRLIQTARTDRIGVVVPRVLNEDLTLQRTVIPITTAANALVRATGLSRFIPNRWQPEWSTHWDHSHSRDIQCAAGPVIALRGELWDSIGGYPEITPMYGEELVLFSRARKLRWRSRFDGDAEFVHLGNTTGQAVWSNPKRAEAMGHAEAVMLRSVMPEPRARLTVFVIAAGLAARFLFYFVTRNRAAAATLRGYMRGQMQGLRAS